MYERHSKKLLYSFTEKADLGWKHSKPKELNVLVPGVSLLDVISYANLLVESLAQVGNKNFTVNRTLFHDLESKFAYLAQEVSEKKFRNVSFKSNQPRHNVVELFREAKEDLKIYQSNFDDNSDGYFEFFYSKPGLKEGVKELQRGSLLSSTPNSVTLKTFKGIRTFNFNRMYCPLIVDKRAKDLPADFFGVYLIKFYVYKDSFLYKISLLGDTEVAPELLSKERKTSTRSIKAKPFALAEIEAASFVEESLDDPSPLELYGPTQVAAAPIKPVKESSKDKKSVSWLKRLFYKEDS